MTFWYSLPSVEKVMFFLVRWCLPCLPEPSSPCPHEGGYREGNQLGDAFFSEVVSKGYSITSSTGLAPLKSGLSGEVLKVGVRFPMRYYTFVAQIVEVLEHQQGSHLPDGVAR
jgi:hypothetical protein